MKYAVDCEVIDKAPRIGMFKVERPEIVAWDFAQYVRLLAAAKLEGDDWYAGACLAGEAGMRVGEVKALRWREDVDMIARTITINQQTCQRRDDDAEGPNTPDGADDLDAARGVEVVREGLVVRNLDGEAKGDGQASWVMARICRRAKLPVHYWHTLRHTFGTHAALFGVNPWRLQAWLGHKRIDETMLYVHVAEAHHRELPEIVSEKARGIDDPDKRVIAMLGARAAVELTEVRGSHAAAEQGPDMKKPATSAG